MADKEAPDHLALSVAIANAIADPKAFQDRLNNIKTAQKAHDDAKANAVGAAQEAARIADAVGERERAVAHREAVVEAREKALQADVASKRAQLDADGDSLIKARNDVRAREDALPARETKVAAKESELAAREAAIGKREAEAEAMRRSYEVKIEKLKEATGA